MPKTDAQTISEATRSAWSGDLQYLERHAALTNLVTEALIRGLDSENFPDALMDACLTMEALALDASVLVEADEYAKVKTRIRKLEDRLLAGELSHAIAIKKPRPIPGRSGHFPGNSGPLVLLLREAQDTFEDVRKLSNLAGLDLKKGKKGLGNVAEELKQGYGGAQKL